MLSAARTLGMRESKVFFRVALPLAAPGVAAGAILSMARAMGEFGATLMLAGNIAGRTQTMPVAIYFALQGGKTELAVFWTAVMLAISLGSIALMQAVTGAQRRKA